MSEQVLENGEYHEIELLYSSTKVSILKELNGIEGKGLPQHHLTQRLGISKTAMYWHLKWLCEKGFCRKVELAPNKMFVQIMGWGEETLKKYSL